MGDAARFGPLFIAQYEPFPCRTEPNGSLSRPARKNPAKDPKAEAANIAALSDQVELLGHWLRHGASVCGGGDRGVFRLEGIAMNTHKRVEGPANSRS